MMLDSRNQSFELELSSPVICIVGPTASGKTDLAQQLALRIDGEVVGADSMQVYRGMDIGTGKLPAKERLVPHYGIDLVDPGKPYSAALYQRYARACFRDIDARGKRIILAGGTGFYIRAAIDAYNFPEGEQVGNAVRDYYMDIAHTHGTQAVWDLLNECDPESAKLIAPADVKRTVRAFELLEDGTSYAQQRSQLASIPQAVPARFFGLLVESGTLRSRIDARVDAMIEKGLIDEVKHLLNQGFRDGVTAPQAIGYKEIVAALDGDISLDEAIQRIKTATHRYAKRQRTWFKKDERICWLATEGRDTLDLVDEVFTMLNR